MWNVFYLHNMLTQNMFNVTSHVQYAALNHVQYVLSIQYTDPKHVQYNPVHFIRLYMLK